MLPPHYTEPYSRRACLRDLLRMPTADEISQQEWTECPVTQSQISLLVKNYQGIDVDLQEYRLTDSVQEAQLYLETIYHCHSMYLYKSPLRENLPQFFCWLRVYGRPAAEAMVMDWIQNQNEYKFLGQCLDMFLKDRAQTRDDQEHKIRIRYYGPIGTSGYAGVCHDIVASLAGAEALTVDFIPLAIQNFNPKDTPSATSSACPCATTRELRDAVFLDTHVDVVVMHSVPDLWIPIVKREKKLNPNVITCGITVWETSHVPPQWIPHLRWVDRVSFPNQWNTAVFGRDLPGLDVSFLPHPVLPRIALQDSVHAPMLSRLVQDKLENPGLYIVYTINEFSGRKGIELLVKAFADTFHVEDNIILFIKTHGSVSKDVADRYIARLTINNPVSAKIYLDYSRWDEDDITRLHQMSDCFVSLTRSEGHGLGACTAALMGNHVIMTSYGGQLDYLLNIDWVPYREVPASFCSFFDPKHQACLDGPCCQYFPCFLPSQQTWAYPDLDAAGQFLRMAYEKRLVGDLATAAYLKALCGVEAIRDRFEQYLVATVYGQGNRVPFPRTDLPDTYDQPDVFFTPQRLILCDEDKAEASRPVPLRRLNVLSLSCSGYGNVGDDLYAALHRHFLGTEYNLLECNTQTYVNRHGKLSWLPKKGSTVDDDDVFPIDYLVIGGGGIINATETRSSIFRIYLPYCQKHNIPLSLLSVGCAYPQDNGREPSLPAAVAEVWKPLLEYASLISTRSITDRDTIMSIISPTRRHRLHLLPDLAYGAPQLFPPLVDRDVSSFLLYCPTNFCCTKFPDVIHLLQKRLWEHPGSRLVFLAMDGLAKADEYPAPFIKEELGRFRPLFPDALVYQGRHFSGPFRQLMNVNAPVPSDSIIQSLGTVVDLFRRAVHVVTGRYHGLVLAKAFGKPYDIGSANLCKLVDESTSPLLIDEWNKHYILLKDDISTTCILPTLEKDMQQLKSDPELWGEDERNKTIVDIVTQPLDESWESTIPFIQGLSNRQLMERRLQILTKRYSSTA